MSRMEELLPIEELKKRQPYADVKILGMTNLDQIVALEPVRLYNIAINVWNRIIQRRLRRVNPKAISAWVDRADPRTHEEISRIIGETIIHDLIFMRATVWRPNDPNFIVADYLAAEVFPNDVHLADALFRDPTKPLPPRMRRSHDHTHRGLGLLPIVFAKAEAFATKHAKDHITMTAATADLVPLFESHGYRLEQNETAKQFLRLGCTIPMEKVIAESPSAG